MTLLPARLFALLLALAACLDAAFATPAPKSFKTPEKAARTLFEAARSRNPKAMLAVLGPIHRYWILSGDPAMDAQMATRFVMAYAQKASVVMKGKRKAALSVGADDYPVPFPIVKEGDRWFFDALAGKKELLSRRIGRDELGSIQTLHAIVEAQKEFAEGKRQAEGAPEYARKFRSSPGAKDGLYWPDQQGQPPSPLGPLVAKAVREGERQPEGEVGPVPYHGYYFRILTSQGLRASGGASDYIVNGKMTGGFAVVAYPAKYGVSGVMTFMVNQDGTVFEADLGDATSSLASTMQKFDPDEHWKKV